MNNHTASLPHPPMVPGYPLIGNLIDFSRDPEVLFARGQELFGNIFTINLGLKKAVVLIGADNAEFYFKNTDSILSLNKAYSAFENLFGKDFMFTASEEEYKKQKKCMLPAFKGKNLKVYAESMVVEMQQWIAELGNEGTIDLPEAMEKLTMSIAARAFFGAKFRDDMDNGFTDLYKDFSNGLDFILPHKLPLPKFRRCRAARVKLNKMVGDIIKERCNDDPEEHTDFLQYLLAVRDEDGNPLSESMIINFILGIVWAGHETTAGQVGWTFIRLLQNPTYLERVQKEIDGAFINGVPTDIKVFKSLKQLTWAIEETIRLNPSASMTLRYNTEPYNIGGYHIPADWLTISSTILGQRTELFTNPDGFDPDRFNPERAEDANHKFSITNFGGATHKCLGINFAYVEMQVVLAVMFYNYELELLDADPQINKASGAHRPKSPCRLRYKKRIPQKVVNPKLSEINAGDIPEGCPFHQQNKSV